jgi:hypothetical protein
VKRISNGSFPWRRGEHLRRRLFFYGARPGGQNGRRLSTAETLPTRPAQQLGNAREIPGRFSAAAEKGYGIELDARLSSDGQVAYFTTTSFSACAAFRPVEDCAGELKSFRWGHAETSPRWKRPRPVDAGSR